MTIRADDGHGSLNVSLFVTAVQSGMRCDKSTSGFRAAAQPYFWSLDRIHANIGSAPAPLDTPKVGLRIRPHHRHDCGQLISESVILSGQELLHVEE